MSEQSEQSECDTPIVEERELDAPPARVWRAVTRPELLELWIGFAPGPADGARASYRIVEAHAPRHVAYEWHDPQTDEPLSTVRIALDPAPGGRTRLRLTHIGTRGRPMAAANDNRPALSRAA